MYSPVLIWEPADGLIWLVFDLLNKKQNKALLLKNDTILQ